MRREREEQRQYAIPDLYQDFNGLSEPGTEFEFYQHDKNWSNRMILVGREFFKSITLYRKGTPLLCLNQWNLGGESLRPARRPTGKRQCAGSSGSALPEDWRLKAKRFVIDASSTTFR